MQLAPMHPCPSSLQGVGESMQALSVTYSSKGEEKQENEEVYLPPEQGLGDS